MEAAFRSLAYYELVWMYGVNSLRLVSLCIGGCPGREGSYFFACDDGPLCEKSGLA